MPLSAFIGHLKYDLILLYRVFQGTYNSNEFFLQSLKNITNGSVRQLMK